MMYFNTDQYVYKYIIEPISVHFENVNPNLITLLSMPLSFGIYLFNYYPPFGMMFAIVTNILRTLCDFLDGHIARKFNKCSKLGGFLDSVADIAHSVNYLMFLIIIFWPLSSTMFSLLWISSFAFGMSWSWIKGVMFDHDQMAKLGTSPGDIFMALAKYDGLILNLLTLFFLAFVNLMFKA